MKHTLISAVLLAASTANARALRRDLTVQTISGWSSMGCYSDSQQARALSQLKGVGQDVSGTECQAHCQQLGYLYAGVEFGGQCYCDNSVNAASLQVSSSDCNVTCPGDSTQPCGAADRINLFYQGVSQSYNVPGWTSYGCMTDDVSKRTLSHRINADNMTPQVCASACAAANYALAGVEYGSECYCDNYIQNNQTLASDPTTCNMACAGDASLACGGPGRINVFSVAGTTPTAQTYTSHAVALPAGWSNQGCYTDSVGARALSSYITGPESGMTVEYCIKGCAAQGYSFAGLEFGDECYCGSSINNSQGPAADGCNKPCSGDNSEMCGGADRLNLYGAATCSAQLVSSLSADPSGSSFCAAYLNIPTQTFSATVTAPAVTTTNYATTSTAVVQVTSYVTTTVVTTTCSPTAIVKRDATAIPSQYSSIATPALSSACSCLNVPAASTTITATITPTSIIATAYATSSTTTTVTVTATSVVNSCPTPKSCANQGLQYAAFSNPEGANNDAPAYSNFNPEFMKADTEGYYGPETFFYSAVTNSIGGINERCDSDYISVYGDGDYGIPCNYFALNHRGYLYAPATGTYTFTFTSVDDSVFIWTGAKALRGWTRGNADYMVGYASGYTNGQRGPGFGSWSFQMTQGQYLPIRIVFAQAQGPATFQVALTAPNGNVMLSSNSGPSPYVVQYSCDGTSAPQFPGDFAYEL